MVGEDRIRVIVAYHITLAVGQEVNNLAKLRLHLCQDTLPSIPLHNIEGGNEKAEAC